MKVNRIQMKSVLFILVVLLLSACQGADQTKFTPLEIMPFYPENYVCYRTASPLNIDGELSEQAWQNVPWTNLFGDIEGNKKSQPKYNTKAKMLWDDDYLYIGAYLEDPHVWANLTERDAVIFYDNDFEVFIDPNGDGHGYYEYEMNAFNTVWDLMLLKPYREGGPAINNWDINGLKSAVNIVGTINQPDDTDEGWYVEIAFPLAVLHENCGGIAAKGGNQWRINFSRVQWQTEVINGKYSKVINPETNKHYPENNWVWSPQGVVDMHRPETWGFLQFSDHEAGQSEEIFEFDEDELVKWELYTIYHAQRAFRNSKGNFAQSITQLKRVGLPETKYNSKLETTSSLYEAIASRHQSDYMWHINNEGRTWKTKKK